MLHKKNYKTSPERLGGLLFALLFLILFRLSAAAQSFYVVTDGSAGSNFLAHTTATTVGNATSFDPQTCLWTIEGGKIIAIAPDGTKGNTLGYSYTTGGGGGRTYTLQLAASPANSDWTDVSSSPYVSYTGGGGPGGGTQYRYLRYNSGWGMANQNTHAVVTAVAVSDAPDLTSSTTVAYSAALSGAGAVASLGSSTYTASVSRNTTYARTIRTFGSYAATVTVGLPYTVSAAVASGELTDVAWSVSPTTYGTVGSDGTYNVTQLPAGVAYATLAFSAKHGVNSVVATLQVMLVKDAATLDDYVVGTPTGRDDDVVTLNDYEDHAWAYYDRSKASPIRSWNPANVKITYEGNGKVYPDVGTNGKPSGTLADASGVKVGIFAGETQHTFVYYKTLERADGATADNPTGRCYYRAIANPFSVRPKSGSNYTGFYRWRLVKVTNGTVYRSNGTQVNTNGTVNADETLQFAPTAEYGMQVQFEAVWARAYMNVGGSGSGTLVVDTNAYERNFYIGARTSALTSPYTITAVYPDGTNGSGTALTAVPNTTQSNDYTCSADTKFENIRMGANITLKANNHYLCLGHGCGTTNNVMTRVRGMGAGTSDALDYTLRIESGRMNYLAFVKGTYGDDWGNTVGWDTYNDEFTSTTGNHVRVVIGCDYDRAADVNTNLSVAHDAAMGSYCAFSTPTDHHTVHATVKSGSIGATTVGNLGDGGEDFLYLGVSRSYSNTGLRQLYVEGGQIAHIAGGIDAGNVDDTAVFIRMTGGHIMGCLYGSGAFAASSGNRKYVITGGDVRGWVAGACNGIGNNEGGTMTGSTFLYFGGTAKLGYDKTGAAAATTVNDVVGGTIFAAGRGNTTTGSGRVNNSTLVVADEAKVLSNAYGGGNLGYTSGTANVWLFGNCYVGGKVFGGSNIKGGSTKANVTMRGGHVVKGVYGAINGEGYTGTDNLVMSGDVTVRIEGGEVGTEGDYDKEVGHVFGCGYGEKTRVNGAVQVFIGSESALTPHADNPVVYGNVYAGGHAAPHTVGAGKDFEVVCTNGLIKGSVFGGGKGNTAVVTGNTHVLLQGSVTVDKDIFGGGHAGNVVGSTKVEVK